MASESIPAAFGVIHYLWDRIQSAGILGNDYAGMTPIVPIEEEANLLEAINEQTGIKTAPYIIYSYYNGGYLQNWWEQEDTLILVIHSLDQTKLRQLSLLITNNLKRYDDSAQAVNRFIDRTYPLPAGITEDEDGPNVPGYEYRAFAYKYIMVASGSGGVPGNAENEPIQAALTVRVCYTNKGNDKSLS